MTVKINNQDVELENGSTIESIARERQLPATGVAIAVNNEMVTRGEWGGCSVKEGDDIVILKAFCGG